MAAARSDFRGKVVVVTGAASGIGRSTALLFSRLGAKVHVADVDASGAEAVQAEIEARGGESMAHLVDVSKAAEVEAVADRVFAEDGAVDVLHNNAGIAHGGPIEDTELEVWQRVIDVNLMGTIYGFHYFLPRMLKQGRWASIVSTASAAGLFAAPGLAPYCASKFGIVGLTQALHAELAPKGIHVAAVCPGVINTPITKTAMYRGEMVDRATRIQAFYEARGVSPDEVAEAVVEAVRKKRMIQVVPKSHVLPPWWLNRVSPRAYQAGVGAVMKRFGLSGEKN